MSFLPQADSKHYLTKSYLEKFSLITRKRLYYLCFYRDSGKRLTDQYVIIQKIKSYINRERTKFN